MNWFQTALWGEKASAPTMKKASSLGTLKDQTRCDDDQEENGIDRKHLASKFSRLSSISDTREPFSLQDGSWRPQENNVSTTRFSNNPLRKVSSWSGPQRSTHWPKKRSYLPTFEPQDESEILEDSTTSAFSLRVLPRTLAKLSFLILALTAVVNVTSFSGESFLFRSQPASSSNRRALGSAAIKSVTETLSPILPFTGGIDLRKEDYWTASSSTWETFQSMSEQVWNAFASNNADSTSFSSSKTSGATKATSANRPKIAHTMAISASDSFLSTQDIGDLSLEDVSTLFRYAMESNKQSFDENRFVGRQVPRVRKAIQSLKAAVQNSRGDGVKLSKATVSTSGSVDTLMFLAAMRIFGEWRVIRQVPDGYKGYAVGMNLGQKDIVQNVAKVETAVHSWLDTTQEDQDELRSPTLAQLMEYEAEAGLHPHLPRLKDKTAAMGLLWVRRQLEYQTHVFENVVQSRKRFPTTTDAVAAAYDQVYNRYHGWAVQKIFSYSFQAAPDTSAIFRHMNPHKLKELRDSKIPVSATRRSEEEIEEEVQDDNEEQEENPVVLWFKKLEKDLDNNPVVSWFKRVGDDSKRLVEDIRDKILPQDNNKSNIQSENSESAVEDYITEQMTKDAHENIAVYLETTKPLLDDLAAVFSELNMNDPTKV